MDEQRRQAAEPVDPDAAVSDTAREGAGRGPRWRGGEGPVLLVVALLAFVGSVSVARYIGGMLVAAGDPATRGGDADLSGRPDARSGEPL